MNNNNLTEAVAKKLLTTLKKSRNKFIRELKETIPANLNTCINKKAITEDHIDLVISNFNFDRVQKTMKALNWSWSSSDTENGLPNKLLLQTTARELLEQSYKGKDEVNITSIGGFEAIYDRREQVICLRFVVEDVEFFNI